MSYPIIERDVVLIGKSEEGNDTFDFPVTRLGNIENDAETKASPDDGDYFPVIDNSDGGKMKKTPAEGILKPLNEHIEDNTKHITAEERNKWNGKASGDHNHDGRYYTRTETDSKLSGKSDNGHTHDERYYTETEINAKLAEKSDKSHTHDDRYYTETEINTKLSDKANKTHTHSIATPTAPGFISSADKTKIDGIKLSGINATYGRVPYAGDSTVEIPHKVDLLFAWVTYHSSSEPNFVALSALCNKNTILSGDVTLTTYDTSAVAKFSFREGLQAYCYYAALQLS